MKEPLFKLRDEKAESETSIRLHAHHPNFPHRRFIYGFKAFILPELWDAKSQRPTKDKAIIKPFKQFIPTIENDLLNTARQIEKISDVVKDYFRLMEINKSEVTAEGLRLYLDERFDKRSEPVLNGKKETLNEYLDRYIKELESGIRLNDGNLLATGSIKNFKTFKAQFDLFQKDNVKLNYEDITMDFYNSFIRFLNSKDYRTNTIGKHVARLKVIMRASLGEGLHGNTEFERKDFKVLQVATDEIYLTANELSAIAKADLSEKPHLDLYRDIFLIGCYTAQRVSDYNNINPHNIITLKSGAKAISLHQKKQKEKVIIPIKKELEIILKKYDYSPPRVHPQKLNDNIKTICEIANINTPIEIEEIKGGRKVKEIILKYNMVSSHTARRTGATLMHKAHIPTLSIMHITGHKKESTFLKYIKVSKEETAEKLSSHKYFD